MVLRFRTRDDLKRTVLFEIFINKDINCAALLLTHGISISACDQIGNTVLHGASQKGAHKHVELFNDQGIELEGFNTEGLAPLHLAIRHGRSRVVDKLLRRGAGVNTTNGKVWWTPLTYASSSGPVEPC